jgi:hypothetical protein
MTRTVSVQLVTAAGDRIDGEVKNLTATGMFVVSAAEVRIGQSMTAKLLSNVMPAQVLFINEEPPGFVVSLRPSDAARDVILGVAPDVAVIKPQVENLWSEDTGATNVDRVAEVEEPADVELPDVEEPADVELPEVEEPADVELPDVEILEPAEECLSAIPSEPSSPSSPSPAALASDLVFNDGTDSDAPISPTLMAAASRDDADVDDSAQETVDGMPAFRMEETPIADVSVTAPEPAPEPVMEESSTDSTVEALGDLETLPTLGDDGHTVRFDSSDAYGVQYAANIEHGGLVVLGDALPIGTQRMLALEVPGSEKYTVSARVIYHQDGKTGWMLDSFNIHKARLKQLVVG